MTTYSKLASASATRAAMAAHGLQTNKALGQHFLVDDGVVGRIIRLANLTNGQSIVEVGPGIGTLTLALLGADAQVNAVEKDKNLLDVLAANIRQFAVQPPNLVIIGADALDLAAVIPQFSTPPTALVANLPYAVGATIVLEYFSQLPQLQSATVMLQKEVAERIMAAPGSKNYGAYTVKLQLLAKPTGHFNVAPTNFYPPPKVDSTVIKLERIKRPRAISAEREAREAHEAHPHSTPATRTQCESERAQRASEAPRDQQQQMLHTVPAERAFLNATNFVINAAFAQRRKTIRNSMRSYFLANNQSPSMVDVLLASTNIDPKTRGETLTVEVYRSLGKAFLEAQTA